MANGIGATFETPKLDQDSFTKMGSFLYDDPTLAGDFQAGHNFGYVLGFGATMAAAKSTDGAGAAIPLEDDLAAAAQRAAQTVGPGSGSVYGTKVHSAFENEVNALGKENVHTEVSYLNGQVVPYGTKGSVRLDVVNGPVNAPVSVFDLKTGSASLTPARIQQIQSNIPGGSSVPVSEVRP